MIADRSCPVFRSRAQPLNARRSSQQTTKGSEGVGCSVSGCCAQSHVYEFRIGLVREHANAWRQHAEELRRQAAEAGDATQVVSVAVQGGSDGARMEPRLEFTRNVLADEAARADGRADWLNGYLARGDALSGESLAILLTQLQPLPAEALETAAV